MNILKKLSKNLIFSFKFNDLKFLDETKKIEKSKKPPRIEITQKPALLIG